MLAPQEVARPCEPALHYIVVRGYCPTQIQAMTDGPTQLDKFQEAASQLETDDNPERFKERLGKLVKHRPNEKSGTD